MNQMPSLPGSGSIWFTVAPVHAWMAGCIRTVLPTAENEKGGLMPVTLY
jgi:hypothetical protein